MAEHDIIAWPPRDDAEFDIAELRTFLSEIGRDGWVIVSVVPAPGDADKLLLFVTRGA